MRKFLRILGVGMSKFNTHFAYVVGHTIMTTTYGWWHKKYEKLLNVKFYSKNGDFRVTTNDLNHIFLNQQNINKSLLINHIKNTSYYGQLSWLNKMILINTIERNIDDIELQSGDSNTIMFKIEQFNHNISEKYVTIFTIYLG